MTNHGRPIQTRLGDIAPKLLHNRRDEGAIAMDPGLSREPGQLHQMHPVCRLQPVRLGAPDLT